MEDTTSRDSCDRFLKFHDSLRKSGRFYNFDHGSEDYRLYISAIAGKPQVIDKVFFYCIRTDDLELMVQLMNHLGPQYIFTHFSTLYEPSQAHELGDYKPLFYVVALYGSTRVLRLLAQARLSLFMEAQLEKTHKYPVQLQCLSEEEYNKLKTDRLPLLCSILSQPTIRLKSMPILVAAAKNHTHIVSQLLQYGVDPNSADEHGSTSAILAAAFNAIPILTELAQYKDTNWNQANGNGFTPFLVACQRGHLETLQFLSSSSLLTHRIDFKVFNSVGIGCVALAAIYNHSHILPFLSTLGGQGVDIHQPVTLSTLTFNIQNVQILQQDTPFLISARNNHYHMIRAFLKLPNSKTTTCLHTRDVNGMSAIHIAAKQNYPPVIQEILDASIPKQTLKAILDSEDAAGKTPLYYASLKGFLNIVTLLAPLSDCSYSCCISDSDSRVQPAILAASANGHADIVELLIQNGALVDQTDSHGHTAVSVAAKLGHLNVVKVLVKHGADLNIRSINQGGTPLQKAKKYKQEHVVEFLNEVMYEERRSSIQSRQDAYSVTRGWIGS